MSKPIVPADELLVANIPNVGNDVALRLVGFLGSVLACDAVTVREQALLARSGVLAAIAARRRVVTGKAEG